MLPNPDILNDFPQGKFVLSNLAAKRAKQLREGAIPLVHIDSHHPLTIALAEIAAGKIKPIMSAAPLELDTDDLVGGVLLSDEAVPAEFGLLLPALDESESTLIADEVIDDSHDADGGHADDELSLSDLAGEDDAEEEIVESDDDTLSLNDLADEEASLEDDGEASDL